jgi:cytochrome c peroxidase
MAKLFYMPRRLSITKIHSLKSILISGFLVIFILLFYNCSTNNKVVSFNEKVIDPEGNPSSEAKIELGRMLFFDKELSLDGKISCATCHQPKLAFSDGLATSTGVFGRKVNRNAPSLVNVGYQKTLMFDGELKTLEMQAIVPIQEHNEMGMDMRILIEKLSKISKYQNAAREIFKRDLDPFVLTRALGAFQRSLIAINSPFDQYVNGNLKSISKEAKLGYSLFSEKFRCIACHPVGLFTNHEILNNGIYSDYKNDPGRFRIHEDSLDIGKFKVPTLRNISITAPYMHDGSFLNLDQVIDHYASGGKKHKNQDKRIVGFKISANERASLKAFLISLTDTSFVSKF